MRFPTTPSFRLINKRSLITGAGKGIGLGASIALAEAGSEIVMVSRSENDLINIKEYLAAINPKTSYKVLDVTDTNEVKRFIEYEKPFDILINNAGSNIPSSLEESSEKDFEYILSLNVKSLINVTKHVVKKMSQSKIRGSIINVSSQMGLVGASRRTAYCTTKFAVEGFTKSLAIELAPKGIRVNSICPTFIRTEMTKKFFMDKNFENEVLKRIPLNRIGKIEDLMGSFVFLASEASSLVTGASLVVDGGWTAQ